MGGYEILLIAGVLIVLFVSKWFSRSFRDLRKEPDEARSLFRWLGTMLALVIVLAVVYAYCSRVVQSADILEDAAGCGIQNLRD